MEYKVVCPRCHRYWVVAQGSPYWLRAREAALQARIASATCAECRTRKTRVPAGT